MNGTQSTKGGKCWVFISWRERCHRALGRGEKGLVVCVISVREEGITTVLRDWDMRKRRKRTRR